MIVSYFFQISKIIKIDNYLNKNLKIFLNIINFKLHK